MHPASMENMRRCLDWYGPDQPNRVVDIGSSNVNGSYRELFNSKTNYIGLDLEAGPGVDIVLTDPYQLTLDDGSVDLVISGQMLEHCPEFWRMFSEISRIMTEGGLAFIIAPSTGPIHRYPVDCYRFYPDAYDALANWAGLRLVDCWLDERSQWRDLVGVFQKGGDLTRRTRPPAIISPEIVDTPSSDPAKEVTAGQKPYTDVLSMIHDILEPKFYVEIGVRKGRSLSLCKCEAVACDPAPEIEALAENHSLYTCTSDDFFFFHAKDALSKPVNLAFIDGMHFSEFVYRDFMNLEKFMSPHGVIVINDVLPNHPAQAHRTRQSRVWCGDVWRFVELLGKIRPDLHLTWLDTSPTGLLVIRGLKPANTLLGDRYNPLVRGLLEVTEPPPQSLMDRDMAITPNESSISVAIGRP